MRFSAHRSGPGTVFRVNVSTYDDICFIRRIEDDIYASRLKVTPRDSANMAGAVTNIHGFDYVLFSHTI